MTTAKKKINRKFLIVCLIFMAAGLLVMGTAAAAAGFDGDKLFPDHRTLSRVDLDGPFYEVEINTGTDHVTLVPSEGNYASADLYQSDNLYYDVKVENQVLKINLVRNRPWYSFIGPDPSDFHAHELRLFLPAGTYEKIRIATGTGNITLEEGIHARHKELTSGTGKVTDSHGTEIHFS